MIIEDNPDKVLQIFADLVNHGMGGIYITKEEPEKIREKYNLKKVPIFWTPTI